MKRIFDIVLSIFLIIIFVPLNLLIALLIFMETGFPIFYQQIRIGKNGEFFSMYKFRSMEIREDENNTSILTNQPNNKMLSDDSRTRHDDHRITRIGKFIRKYSLDELPQFVNVLKGQMSIVGPRPYLPEEIDREEPVMQSILSVPPGITGLWQVNGRNNPLLEARIQLDCQYINQWSIGLDIWILFKTIWVIVGGTGS